jgi:hypothetical protein
MLASTRTASAMAVAANVRTRGDRPTRRARRSQDSRCNSRRSPRGRSRPDTIGAALGPRTIQDQRLPADKPRTMTPQVNPPAGW